MKGGKIMIQKEKKTQVILDNATHEGDTGSPEVQIAILTARINELTEHLRVHMYKNMARPPTKDNTPKMSIISPFT